MQFSPHTRARDPCFIFLPEIRSEVRAMHGDSKGMRSEWKRDRKAGDGFECEIPSPARVSAEPPPRAAERGWAGGWLIVRPFVHRARARCETRGWVARHGRGEKKGERGIKM